MLVDMQRLYIHLATLRFAKDSALCAARGIWTTVIPQPSTRVLVAREFSTESHLQLDVPSDSGIHSVRAYHVGCKIQLQQLLAAFPAAVQQGRHHVVLRLDQFNLNDIQQSADSVEKYPRPTWQSKQGATQLLRSFTEARQKQAPGALDPSRLQTVPHYALAFRFGSVVFFPSYPIQDDHVLHNLIKPFVEDPEPKVHDEDTLVEVRPTLDKWVERGRDKIIVRTLDPENISLIACALGQSAALDHYTEQANAALEEYYSFKLGRPDPAAMRRKEPMGQDDLLCMVARNRQLRVEVISLLGILDKSEAAWRSDKYFMTWQTLTKEFELPRRLEVLLDKLSYLEDEVKYELETHHSRNLEMLVNIVIVLLVLSVVVTVYHLSKGWTIKRQKLQDELAGKWAESADDVAPA